MHLLCFATSPESAEIVTELEGRKVIEVAVVVASCSRWDSGSCTVLILVVATAAAAVVVVVVVVVNCFICMTARFYSIAKAYL